MRPRSPALLLVVTAAVLLAGCTSQAPFYPAEIPASNLATGWALDDANSQRGEQRAGPVTVQYAVNAYQHADQPVGGAFVVSVTDVPVVDEQAEIDQRLQPLLASYGVTLRETGRSMGTVRGDAAEVILYDATLERDGHTLDAKAIDVRYACGANGEAVRIFGVAAIEQKLFARDQPDMATWGELAGNDHAATLGGMVSQVRCS